MCMVAQCQTMFRSLSMRVSPCASPWAKASLVPRRSDMAASRAQWTAVGAFATFPASLATWLGQSGLRMIPHILRIHADKARRLAEPDFLRWPDVHRRVAEFRPVEPERSCIGLLEPDFLFRAALCRHVMQWTFERFLEWAPVMSGVGQVQMPGLVHFVARRHDAFTKPTEIGKPQIFDNDPSRKAFAPAIVSGKARGEREIRFHIVRVAGLKPIPEAGILQFGSPFRVAIAVTGRC